MQIRDVKNILDAEVLSGEELLDTEVHAACGSDMMSDVLAYVKDQAVLLTGLLNRRGGQEKAETMLAMCRRCEKPMAVLMADIDHFKEYNDAHGHLAGDGALCRVGGAAGGTSEDGRNNAIAATCSAASRCWQCATRRA